MSRRKVRASQSISSASRKRRERNHTPRFHGISATDRDANHTNCGSCELQCSRSCRNTMTRSDPSSCKNHSGTATLGVHSPMTAGPSDSVTNTDSPSTCTCFAVRVTRANTRAAISNRTSMSALSAIQTTSSSVAARCSQTVNCEGSCAAIIAAGDMSPTEMINGVPDVVFCGGANASGAISGHATPSTNATAHGVRVGRPIMRRIRSTQNAAMLNNNANKVEPNIHAAIISRLPVCAACCRASLSCLA